MANNRELSQFGSFINVDDTTRNVGIATTVRITAGGLFVGAVQAIRPDGTWGGSSAGIQGAQGTTGTQGTTGAQGTQGTTGTQGATGTQGTTGTQGATGTQGTTGTQGATGTQGTTGTQGATGPVGGSNTQILFNSSGTASGSANMTFDGTRPTFATLRTDSILPSGGLPAGASGGGIVQVVSTTKLDTASTASTTFTDITGLSVTITPRSTSNKIFIMFNVNVGQSTGSTTGWRLVRGSTDICNGTYGNNYTPATVGGRISSSDDGNALAFTMSHLDSPATTSSTTYKIQWATQGGTAFLNRASASSGGSSTGVDRVATTSSITIMEVSG